MSRWTITIDLDEMTPKQAGELLKTVDDFLDDFDPVQRLTLTARPVQDLACPKCGSRDVRLWYQATTARCRTGDICLADAWGEHFHRACEHCHNNWPTRDVLGTTTTEGAPQ